MVPWMSNSKIGTTTTTTTTTTILLLLLLLLCLKVPIIRTLPKSFFELLRHLFGELHPPGGSVFIISPEALVGDLAAATHS